MKPERGKMITAVYGGRTSGGFVRWRVGERNGEFNGMLYFRKSFNLTELRIKFPKLDLKE